MPIPSISKMMPPTIQALARLSGSARNQEIADEVADVVSLTEEEQNETLRDGRNKFKVRLSNAKSHLKYGDLIVNSEEGVWSLTSKGIETSRKRDEEVESITSSIYNENRQRRKRERLLRQEADTENLHNGEEDAEEEASDINNEEDWKRQLLATLKEMDPYAFERLCQRLLRASGFESVAVTTRSGDGGIDGVGVLQINLVTFRVVFQCKKWSNSISSPEIDKFRGAMQSGDKGLLITTGVFTRGARENASSDPSRSIDLVDGDRLCDLLKNLGLGVSAEMVERVNIDREWFSGI